MRDRRTHPDSGGAASPPFVHPYNLAALMPDAVAAVAAADALRGSDAGVTLVSPGGTARALGLTDAIGLHRSLNLLGMTPTEVTGTLVATHSPDEPDAPWMLALLEVLERGLVVDMAAALVDGRAVVIGHHLDAIELRAQLPAIIDGGALVAAHLDRAGDPLTAPDVFDPELVATG